LPFPVETDSDALPEQYLINAGRIRDSIPFFVFSCRRILRREWLATGFLRVSDAFQSVDF